EQEPPRQRVRAALLEPRAGEKAEQRRHADERGGDPEPPQEVPPIEARLLHHVSSSPMIHGRRVAGCVSSASWGKRTSPFSSSVSTSCSASTSEHASCSATASRRMVLPRR